MEPILDASVHCGHCKEPFAWRAVLVQTGTPGSPEGRRRPRAFCPSCGYLILDTPGRDEAWTWHGELNALANRNKELCPPATRSWGRARIKGADRPLPLLIPEDLRAPLEETFVNARKIKTALLRLPAMSRPPEPPAPPAAPTANRAAAELARGLEKVHLKDFAGALAHFDRALLLSPDYADAFQARGCAKGELSDYAGAVRDYGAALDRGAASADAYCGRGFYRALTGEDEGALADFSAALKADPSCAAALVNRGLLRSRSQDPAAAIADFSAAIGLDAGDPRPLVARGILAAQAGRYADGVEDFRAALALDPNDARAHQARGVAELELGEPLRAAESFGRAVALDAEFSEAYLGRAIARASLGDLDAALEDAGRAVELDPSDDEARRQRGVIRVKLGLSPGEAPESGSSPRLISDELDARIRGRIGAYRRRAGIFAFLSALSLAWGVRYRNSGEAYVIALAVLNYFVFGQLAFACVGAIERAKGGAAEERDFVERFLFGLVMPVVLPYTALRALFRSKTCFHCATKNRFYGKRCPRCGASQ